tara:strand:+ start:3080 stop:3286 length:207 start_codon:yes stop_codon:yes gene_type:complete
MPSITIDEVEYNIEDFTNEATEILNIIQLNQRITNDKDHEIQCLKAIASVKIAELKKLLTGEDTPTDG